MEQQPKTRAVKRQQKKFQREEDDENEEVHNQLNQESKEVYEEKIMKKPSKVGRPKVVEPNQEIVIMEQPKEEKQYISYTQAKKLIKEQKPKRELSEKQKENLARLLELNKKRREEKKLNEEKEKMKKVVVVKPKRIYKAKSSTQVVATEVDTEADVSDDESDMKEVRKVRKVKKIKPKYESETDGDTTDTKAIKKKIQKLSALESKVEEQKKVVEQKKEIGFNFF